MEPAFSSEHHVDVRLLDREASISAQKVVRTHLDIPLLKAIVDGSFDSASGQLQSLAVTRSVPTLILPPKRGTKRSSTTALKGKKAAKRRKTDHEPAAEAPEQVDVEMFEHAPKMTNRLAAGEGYMALGHQINAQAEAPEPVFTFVVHFDLYLARGKSVEHFQPSSRISKAASLDALYKEEEALAQAVGVRLQSSGEDSLEVCDVVLHPTGSSVQVLAVRGGFPRTTAVLDFMPPAPFGGEGEDYDFSPSASNPASLLHAAIHLASIPQPRVSIRSTLHASPCLDRGRSYVPVKLSMRTVISVLPAIFVHPWSLPLLAQESQRMLLTHIFPLSPPPESYPGTTSIPFFYSSLQPAPVPAAELERFQPDALEAHLLPFQKRSVAWLLSREGLSSSESTRNESKPTRSADLMFYSRVQPFFAADLSFEFSSLTGSLLPVSANTTSAEGGSIGDGIMGGMLSEEMGLGKTLECLALILLNPAPAERGPWNVLQLPGTESHVREIKTTLIVSPSSLIQQWADEIALHAPELRVLMYKGWRREMSSTARDEEGRISAWAKSTQGYDIVLTTFDDLRKDFYVSLPRKSRPRRDTAVYATGEDAEVIKSPLVAVEWWRVIMDEVQLQGDGKAAAVVSLIPRRSSLAVSGTPVQDDIRDLVQVLKFLRVPVLTDSQRLWNRFLKPAFASQFVELFGRIGIRTLKSQVSGELTIPPQRRYVVPIGIGPVERHLYNDLLVTAYTALGVDEHGRSVAGGPAEIDASQLRTWLLRLRQSCTHPQIGQLQRGDRVLGGSLRSISEVLDLMRYQNRQSLLNERRDRIEKKAKHGLLMQQDEANIARWKNSLEIFLALKDDIQVLIDEVKGMLDAQVTAARAEREKDRETGLGAAHDSHLLRETPSSRAKGKAIAAIALDSEEEDGWSDDDDDAGHTARVKGASEKENRIKTSRVWIRECYTIQHKIFFALGDIYHKLGKPEEDEMYGQAESIRRTMLKNSEDVASRAMSRLRKVVDKGVTLQQLEVATAVQQGLRGALLYDEANEVIALLNDQRELLWKWRQSLLERLTKPLSAEGEASGEEYAQALDAQGEAEAYLVAYASLLADRKEALSQEKTMLALHESKESNARRTRAAQNAGIDATFAAAAAELEPQNEVLTRALMQERKKLRETRSRRALKAIFLDMSNLATTHEREIEGTLLKAEAVRLRKAVTDQEALNVKLESELALFRQAFNGRILYFRQLQELSDSVVDLDVMNGGEAALQKLMEDEMTAIRRLDDSIRALQAKQRYLDNMGETNGPAQAASSDAETRECILCSSEFEKGCLTACGHIYCEDCLNAWFKKGHKACPVCRTPITRQTIHRIAFKGEQSASQGASQGALESETDRPPTTSVNGTKRSAEYNTIDLDLLEEINDIETQGSYGAKVGTLVKHLLYLKQKEPEAKSIVFSAWVDSLNIIQKALDENGITCLRVEAGRNAAREFRLDPGCRVLLLHGERQNAGLNVTCASRVFLLEPVVNHAFEVQAIGRVDRMGQTRNTEVFCYYAIDTVEKGVLDLAARNGASIYTKTSSSTALSLETFDEDTVMRSPQKGKKAKGDFMAKSEDMLAILFPDLDDPQEQEESFDEDMQEEVARTLRRTEAARAAERRLRAAQSQPVAGPSRLR